MKKILLTAIMISILSGALLFAGAPRRLQNARWSSPWSCSIPPSR